jgi:Uncharacterised protein family (UPF0182)
MIETPLHIEPPRPPSIERRAVVVNYRFPRWRPLRFIIAAVAVLIALLAFIPGWVQKWLRMRQDGYAGVFWTIWSVRWELFAAAFVAALLYPGFNLRLAQRNGAAFSGGKSTVVAELGIRISPMGLKLATGAIAVAAALVFAAIFYTQWDTLLRFRYGGSLGVSDPLFKSIAASICFDCLFMNFCRAPSQARPSSRCWLSSLSTSTSDYCLSSEVQGPRTGARRLVRICPSGAS